MASASCAMFDERCRFEQVMEALRLYRSSMERLTVHSLLTDQALDEILAFLQENSAVSRMRALLFALNPLLTSVSVIRLADHIKANTLSLRELDLSNNAQAFTIKSLCSLENALSVQGCSPIERLNLAQNGLNKREMCTSLERLLRHNRTITHLNLSHNHLGSRHLQILAPGLAQNTTLRNLNVSHNPLKDAGVKKLMASSIVNVLTTLDLTLTHCGRTGASHIQNCLLHNRSIQNLHLGMNLIGTDGAAYFQAALCHNYTLRELKLSHNNIRNEGMRAITQGILYSDVTRLTHLDVSSNGLTDARIIGDLIHKSILVDLNLRENAIVDMTPLATAVHGNLSLKNLDISQNHMTDPSCWIDLMYHGSYSLDLFIFEDNHLDHIQSERLETAVSFLQNEKTWLAKVLHQIETRPRVALDLMAYSYGDEEMIRIATTLGEYGPTVTQASFTHIGDRGFLSLGRHVFRDWKANIVRLHLQDCRNVSAEGWNGLARAIGIRNVCPLENLSLLRCRLPQPLILASTLRQNQSLKRLCLEANHLSSVDAKIILAAALDHPQLIYLDLAHNGLTDEVLLGMSNIERLRTLKLHNNEFTDRGALSLAQAVMDCQTLNWLTLKGNRLTHKGITSLTLFLKLDHILDCND